MAYRRSFGRTVFVYGNYLFLAALAILCILPIFQVLAVSFSSSGAAGRGVVMLWPVEFTLDAYEYVANKKEFIRSFGVTVARVLAGTAIGVFLTILVAYPLSRSSSELPRRTLLVWIFVFTMLFHGGLIPTYIVMKNLHLLNTFWVLILPPAVNVFNVVLMLNFFRGIPKELLEASHMDGAGHWQTLWRVVVPVSVPSLATITLFTVVFHWNSWFDGIIYMNSTEKYPLQSYMHTIMVKRDMSNLSPEEIKLYANISDRNIRAAQVFLGMLPILMLYPFLQRFFMSGIVMGSVKE